MRRTFTPPPTTLKPGQQFELVRDFAGEVRLALAQGNIQRALSFLDGIETQARNLYRAATK